MNRRKPELSGRLSVFTLRFFSMLTVFFSMCCSDTTHSQTQCPSLPYAFSPCLQYSLVRIVQIQLTLKLNVRLYHTLFLHAYSIL